ncbi:MAG: porin family protein [Daejeonella sp.]|uniref:porin family protein n=1 Tax=Daejeonella sp. TaxID=2805397 RepID=UPI002735A4FC|nr:porin family protein [Daejeonella sp.]MDP3468444.1 porin family protein [Daejeonella sp.]
MKKLTIIALLLIPASITFAQAPKFGFKAGLNFNSVSTNDDDLKDELGGRTSLHFGVITDFSMSKSLSFQPQLLFSGRGAKIDHGDHADVYAFNSLELPLNFTYRKDPAKGIFLGVGPSLGYNLNGNIKSEEHGNEEVEFGSGNGEIKRVDLGLNALLGYQFSNRYFVSTNYSAGLSNWSNNSNSSWRNNIIGISLGVFLK